MQTINEILRNTFYSLFMLQETIIPPEVAAKYAGEIAYKLKVRKIVPSNVSSPQLVTYLKNPTAFLKAIKKLYGEKAGFKIAQYTHFTKNVTPTMRKEVGKEVSRMGYTAPSRTATTNKMYV